MTIPNYVVLALGALTLWLLFTHLAVLQPGTPKSPLPGRISIIIPARNEATNLPGLLQDLLAQTIAIHEIICVDDDSSDETATIAQQYGAQVVSITEKPAGWTGKTYACQQGSHAATGDLLLFIDADVRMEPNALEALLHCWQQNGPALSVQPWHTTTHIYEQASLFFNLVAAVALGVRLPFNQQTPGLFGPVILLPASLYQQVGGHGSVKKSVLEDISLGANLVQHGVRPYNCLGSNIIRFRMYPGGPASLMEGWIKNFATGATKSTLLFLLSSILFISAYIVAPIKLVGALAAGSLPAIVFFAAVYLALLALLVWAAGKVGRFRPLALLLYPLPMVCFLALFAVSAYKKIFRRPVRWKGRNITPEG